MQCGGPVLPASKAAAYPGSPPSAQHREGAASRACSPRRIRWRGARPALLPEVAPGECVACAWAVCSAPAEASLASGDGRTAARGCGDRRRLRGPRASAVSAVWDDWCCCHGWLLIAGRCGLGPSGGSATPSMPQAGIAPPHGAVAGARGLHCCVAGKRAVRRSEGSRERDPEQRRRVAWPGACSVCVICSARRAGRRRQRRCVSGAGAAAGRRRGAELEGRMRIRTSGAGIRRAR
jgi:hypothetical protein